MSEHPDPYALKRPHARIDWTATGPVALDAGDVYFSAEDGLAETRSVFLKAANFPERFARGRPTVVAEPDGEIAGKFIEIALRMTAKLSLQAADYTHRMPKIVIR